MPSIRLRISILNPENTPGWGNAIDKAVQAARRIFGPHGIVIQESARSTLPESEFLLTRDIRDQAATLSRQSGRSAQQEYEFLAGMHSSSQLHTLNVADRASQDIGDGIPSSEALNIMTKNRVRGEVPIYWAPALLAGGESCAGHTVCRPFYTGLPANGEAIFMGRNAPDPTLAHELGHFLMRAGHCIDPDRHEATKGCQCADPNNLMHRFGSDRRGYNLTTQQKERLLRMGARNGYVSGYVPPSR
jgi:hypothetical protein